MTFETFISKLNWRQMIVHFVAFYFFIQAFYTLSLLHNTTMYEIVCTTSNDELVQKLSNFSAADLSWYIFWMEFSKLIGLFIAFLLSLAISFKRNWFWVNACTVFIVMYLVIRFDLSGLKYVRKIISLPGQLISNVTMELIVTELGLLLIGLLIFFHKRIIAFIEHRKTVTE